MTPEQTELYHQLVDDEVRFLRRDSSTARKRYAVTTGEIEKHWSLEILGYKFRLKSAEANYYRRVQGIIPE